MEARYDDPDQRLSDLKQLLALADRFESRQQMLVDLTLDPPTSTADLPDLDELNSEGNAQAKKKKGKLNKEPPLVLSTIHSAKGLEWPVVYVMSANNGCIPLPRAAATTDGYEEERRLLYVALTRAADYLYVSYQEATMSDDFGFGYRRSWAPPSGGLCDYLSAKGIRKLFQTQYASHWQEIESEA
jgi:DNA helicase-2/ATP-dependent DNA helicase PcrA